MTVGEVAYRTRLGECRIGDSLDLLAGLPDGSVDLVVTSPPFALQRRKEYGNEPSASYVDWIVPFARLVLRKLKDTGSFVVDLGGAYESGLPVRSLYNFRVLLRLCDEVGFHLAEDFYWHNPARLPSPIEWVNKRKIRAKDTVDTVWWLSKTAWPKADASKVRVPYSGHMVRLLERQERGTRRRPSGHEVGEAFLRDNGGALPGNLLQIANTESNGGYLDACRSLGMKAHPARFPAKLPEFFISFLTEPGDLVVDIFAGSNTTGAAAEGAGRRWLAFEQRPDYAAASLFRFLPRAMPADRKRALHDAAASGGAVDLTGDARA